MMIKKENLKFQKIAKKQKLQEKGITLIALVITIIILLLLAGVTINLAISNNGLLSKSKEAVEEQKISEYLEKIELARGEVAVNNKGEVTLDNLIDEIYRTGIVEEDTITKIEPDDGGEPTQAMMITDEGYTFILTASTAEYTGKGEPKYTITYDANGGTGEPTAQSKTYGKDLTLSDQKPTKENSVFLGWSENKSDTEGKYQASSSYTDNKSTTLYAIWHTHQDSCYSTACKGEFVKTSSTKVYFTCTHSHSDSCYKTTKTPCKTCDGSGEVECNGSFALSEKYQMNCSCGKTYPYEKWVCPKCESSWDYGRCSSCGSGGWGNPDHVHGEMKCTACNGTGGPSTTTQTCTKGVGTKEYSRNVDTYKCSECNKTYTYEAAASYSCDICKSTHAVAATGSTPGAHNNIDKYLICEYKD